MSTIALDARKIADFGIGTYVRGLVEALARLDRGDRSDRSHRYLLLAGPDGPAALPMLPGNFRWLDERTPGYSLRELVRLGPRLRREGVELYHAPHYVLPLGLRCPAVVTVHDLIHLRFPEHRRPLERRYARWMLRRAVRLARRLLTVSQTTADELTGRLGAPPERIDVIPNGVDDRFRRELSATDITATLARHDLRPGYLLFVGNPKPHKNLGRLLEAYARLLRDRPEAPPLVLAGDRGGARSPLGGWIARAGIEARTRRLGHLPADDLPAIYRGAALLVQPSLWEGFGLPVAEAMAAGTPVVAARRGALPEVAADAAEWIDPEDVAGLARTLGALLDDPERRAELTRLGRERSTRFRWDETARRTLAVYDRVLAEERERRGARGSGGAP